MMIFLLGDDILYEGEVNDYLCGGNGDDVYIFNKGYGVDTINNNSGLSTIKFGDGISPDDITFVKNSNHLEIRINGTECYYGM